MRPAPDVARVGDDRGDLCNGLPPLHPPTDPHAQSTKDQESKDICNWLECYRVVEVIIIAVAGEKFGEEFGEVCLHESTIVYR